ncbi:MAG: acyl-CoA thioesterase [Deltaproteobacteria bacterium]|nr:MAG: acyl-CoA thioesterase [Deltaproteobacteria bacterium]
MTQIVLPTHTNNHGTVFGGQIAAWIDICAAVSAQRYSQGPVVTASIDQLHFMAAVKQGMIVILRSQVNMAWRSSMEIGVRIEAEDPITGRREHCCSAYTTFVALDDEGHPRPIAPFDPGDDPEARRRAEQAGMRRQIRLEMRRRRQAADRG